MDFVVDVAGDGVDAEVERMLATAYGRGLIREMGPEQARVYVSEALSKPMEGRHATAA